MPIPRGDWSMPPWNTAVMTTSQRWWSRSSNQRARRKHERSTSNIECPTIGLLKQAGGILVKEHGRLWLFAKEGSRARGADGAVQCGFDGCGFSFFGRDAEHFFSRTKDRDRERERVLRHCVHVRKMAVADLLHAAGCVELRDFDGARVFEIGDRRIVEGYVAVFADAEAAEVNRLRAQQGGVTIAFVHWQQGVAFEVMKHARLHTAGNAFAHVKAKARLVIAGDAEILVHVKESDFRPIHAADTDEFLKKFDL